MKESFLNRFYVLVFVLFFSTLLIFPLSLQSFPLKAVISYSFPSNLIVSPQGDLVAWVFSSEGKRNIWVAAGPDYKARQLTEYSLDDGQELGGLSFNADGTIIVYVRGGSANRAGEYPNPTSNPEGTEQAVWAVKVEGGEMWRIGQGSGPVPSPVGNNIVYGHTGKIYIASIDGALKPELLFKARGRNGSPTWSPDGTQLAFVSSREDHSFIGVYDFKIKSIKWLSPSVDRYGYPVGSPCRVMVQCSS